MIAVAITDGVLRIAGEMRIPAAANGQWSPARIAKLIQTVEDTVSAAEMVDAAEVEIEGKRNRAA